MKISNDTIDPATFRFVAQCLNNYATAYPPCATDLLIIYFNCELGMDRSIILKLISKEQCENVHWFHQGYSKERIRNVVNVVTKFGFYKVQGIS
jgi:hypothetical protein